MRMRLWLLVPLAGALMLIGCQQDEGDFLEPPEPGIEVPNTPVARQDVYNNAALETFPLQVRSAFRRDFPNAAVTQAQLQAAESGPLLYRIVFIQNGEPQTVLYDRAGVAVNPPAPIPAPAPATAAPPPAPDPAVPPVMPPIIVE